jgi:hypothetical protein
MLQLSNLELEGKCLLSLYSNSEKTNYVFSCNGFNVVQTLFMFSNIDKIKVVELFFDLGEGATYDAISLKDLQNIDTFVELEKYIKSLIATNYKFFINTLVFSSSNYKISVYDGREFIIEYSNDGVNEIKHNINDILSTSFKFSPFVISTIFSTLIDNVGKEILINTQGEVQGIYKDFDEYLSVHHH